MRGMAHIMWHTLRNCGSGTSGRAGLSSWIRDWPRWQRETVKESLTCGFLLCYCQEFARAPAVFTGNLMSLKFRGVDFIEFDSLLTDDERLLRSTARQFVEDN